MGSVKAKTNREFLRYHTKIISNPLCTENLQMGTFINRDDPDEMPHGAYHWGLSFLLR